MATVTWAYVDILRTTCSGGGNLKVKMAEGGISDSDSEFSFEEEESTNEGDEEADDVHHGVEAYRFEPEYNAEELVARAAAPAAEPEDDLGLARMQNTDW